MSDLAETIDIERDELRDMLEAVAVARETDAPLCRSRAQHPPDRRWCEEAKAICVQSRYIFEGKIPAGIQLANKLREESKKPIPDFIEFQSEIMLVTQPHLAELPSLTGLDSTVASALEQNIFWVNQVIQFGKLLAVLQQHPTEREATIATVYILVAVRNDVLNK